VPDVPTPYTLKLSEQAREFLKSECHPDPKIRGEIQRKFATIADQLEQVGTRLDGDKVDKFIDEVWEIRIRHRTGAYRMFFATGFGNVLAVGCGAKKKKGAFTADQKRDFVRRCRAHVEELKTRKA
jgi:phage-related protein